MTGRYRQTTFLQQAGYVCLAILGLGLFIEPRWDAPELNLMVFIMAATALVPMLRWIGSASTGYPIHQTLLALTLPFYVVPLLTEHRALQAYPESLLVQTSLTIWTYQLAILAGAHLVRSTRAAKADNLWNRALFPEELAKLTGYSLGLNTAWLVVSTLRSDIPFELLGTLRAVFFGIGLISAFLQARAWAAGSLSGPGTVWFLLNLVAQILLLAASLLLIQAIILFTLVMLGYFTVRQRMPITATLLVFLLFTILHNGKSEMRLRYWEEGKPMPGVLGLPGFYQEWITVGLAVSDNEELDRKLSLFDRASLFHIVAYTVHRTEYMQMNFGGETYIGIPAQVFPRFLWPNKPSPNDSGRILATGLGILTTEQAMFTSIGFGMIAEAYANFGWLGPPLLGLLLGILLHWIAIKARDAPLLSLIGIFQILLLCWCLSAETTLIVWLSSLYQASIAVLVPFYAAHVFLRR